MELTLSTVDRQIVLAALRRYAIAKTAEGKLAEHKQLKTDRQGAAKTAKRYETLLRHISSLTKRLEAENEPV